MLNLGCCWQLWAPGTCNIAFHLQWTMWFWFGVISWKIVHVVISSGAGKSTLMSALAHRNPAGTTVKGDILVNNRPIGPFMHRLSGFVHQDDLFNGALTVSEHITFMVCILQYCMALRPKPQWKKICKIVIILMARQIYGWIDASESQRKPN